LFKVIQRSYEWVITGIGLLICITALGFSRLNYPIILPNMREDLGFNYTQMGLLGSGILVGYFVFSFPVGILASRYGGKSIINISMIIICISMILIGTCSTFILLFSLVTLLGAGIAGSYIPFIGLIPAWFTPKRFGMVMGIMSSGTGIGIIILGYFIPFLITNYENLAWRYSWISLGIITFLVTITSLILLRNSPEDLGMNNFNSQNLEVTEVEIKETGKLGTLSQIYSDETFRMITIIYFLFGFSYSAFITYFVSYLIEELSITEKLAGNIWASFGLLCIGSGFFWGFISDKLGRRLTLIITNSIIATGVFLPIFFHDIPYLYLSAILFGWTFLGFIIVITALISESVEKNLVSTFLGFSTLIHGIGQGIGSSLGGYLKDLTGRFQIIFILSFLALIACIFCFIFLNHKLSINKNLKTADIDKIRLLG
jgi:sugar phosphate permease